LSWLPDEHPLQSTAPVKARHRTRLLQQLRAASAMGKIEERGNCVIFAIAYSLML